MEGDREERADREPEPAESASEAGVERTGGDPDADATAAPEQVEGDSERDQAEG
jgi:hypothetical protein